ncbi:hypothetical protein HBN50_12705 [Halobacteriovorax sp. GB3]|uniref:hypothetical protein n=1 Tax=Halobacteriovorax sp. GB3 TaxID=2719615 RepID=UPI002361BD21|nr:hypothetical protein [Halobacteriovorax sp. GB3]MDD0853965.1 hypothetical protein [Halobacteriovorax sp. GB3]
MKILAIAMILSISTPALSKTPNSCKKGYTPISCSAVAKKQREGFCWKGKISKAKTQKICLKTPKKK